MSQRVDSNGDPDVGWELFLYLANTSTPVNSYLDYNLTTLNPWPLVADSFGMIGQFWLPNGNYRARAVSSDGSTVYYDQQNIAALGPATEITSGTVDPTTLFQTGDVIWLDVTGTRTGWVRDNGKTIGSATSSASERANADCQNLFIFLWNSFSNTVCPVTPSRGSSASADWGANKAIQLPDKRGFIVGGLDDMGNTAAGRYPGVPIGMGSDYVTPGNYVGEARHVMTVAEMAAHNHNVWFTDTGHNHNYNYPSVVNVASGGGSLGILSLTGTAGTTGNNNQSCGATGSSPGATDATTTSQGGGGAHNNVQYTVLGTFFRKL